jgi:hypothetical protein
LIGIGSIRDLGRQAARPPNTILTGTRLRRPSFWPYSRKLDNSAG